MVECRQPDWRVIGEVNSEMDNRMNVSRSDDQVGKLKNIVIHVGLQKTGTTSLQGSLFKYLANYFGPGMRNESDFGLAGFRQLRSVVQNKAPEVWKSREMRQQREHLRHIGEMLAARGELALVSFENLIATPFFLKTEPNQLGQLQDIESTKHISRILDIIAPDRETTSVLITVRQQWTWLPSLYAQMSDRNPRASQRNFERQVRRYLRDSSMHLSPMNLAYLSNGVMQDIKPDILTLLPMEEMGTKSYEMALRGILGPLVPQEATFDLPRLNRRRQNDAFWKLREYGSGPLSAGLKGSKKPLVALTKKGWRLPGMNGQAFERIFLNEDLEGEIRECVEPWNRQVQKKFTPVGLPGYYSPGTVTQPSDQKNLRRGWWDRG